MNQPPEPPPPDDQLPVPPELPLEWKPRVLGFRLFARSSAMTLALSALMYFFNSWLFGLLSLMTVGPSMAVFLSLATSLYAVLLLQHNGATIRQIVWHTLATFLMQIVIAEYAGYAFLYLAYWLGKPPWLVLLILLSAAGMIAWIAGRFGSPVEDSSKSEPKPIGIVRAVGILIGLLIVQSIVAFYGYTLAAFLCNPENDDSFAWATSTLATVVFAIVCIRKRYGSSAGQALALQAPRFTPTVLVFLLVYPLVLLSQEVAVVAADALGRAPYGGAVEADPNATPRRTGFFDQMDQQYEASFQLPLVLALFVGALLPAVGEELLFRGLIGRGLLARYGTVRGILLTSFLFALIHIDPVRMAATFVMGIAFHVVYLATRSLWASVLLHGINNALVIGIYKLALTYQWDLTCSNEAGNIPMLLLAASAFAAAAIVWAILRMRVRRLGILRTMILIAAVATFATTFALAFEKSQNLRLVVEKHRELIQQGNERFEKQDYPAAVEAYSEAIALRPNDSTGHTNRGLARSGQGEFALALADLDLALALSPKDTVALAARAGALAALGRGEEAVADFNTLARLKPDAPSQRKEWAKYLADRAAVALDRQDYAAALTDLDVAIRLDPHHADALGTLAQLLMNCPDQTYREGRLAIERAMHGNPFNKHQQPGFLERLAAAFAAAGDFPKAVWWQKHAIRLQPNALKQADATVILKKYEAGLPP